MSPLRPLSLIAIVACAASLEGQGCQRPRPGSGGHSIVIENARRLAYTDGYVTEGNLLRPDYPPPSCGWPLVVFIHRLGTSRVDEIGFQQRIAAAGYAVWAYDVRGQGGAPALNLPSLGTTMYGGNEKCDLAEQIGFVRQCYPGVVSADKVAVAGFSQGGVHAWFAAALSETSLEVPGRGTFEFPRITAVVPMDFIAEPTAHRLRGGTLFSSWLLTLIADDTMRPFVLDQGFMTQVREAFLDGDPGHLLAAWRAEPGRMVDHLLPSSSVPILFSHAYHDLICSPSPGLRMLRSLPTGSTWRAIQSTVGHNTPANAYERAFLEQLVLRWLHRFLWDEANEVEREERLVRALMPLDRAVWEDPSSLWGRVIEPDDTAIYTNRRLFLHSDGTLQDVEPTGPVQSSSIEHDVAAVFTPEYYLQLEAHRTPAGVLPHVPLSECVFAASPLVEETQLGRGGQVSLELDPANNHLCVAALLTVEAPGGEELMLSSWGRGVFDAIPRTPIRVDMELPDMATVLPAGTVIRLRLRNLWLREAPMQRAFEVAPLFDPFRIDILHGSGRQASWLDLPVRTPSPQLVSAAAHIDTAAPAPVHFDVRGGAGRAGDPYFIAVSMSGHLPGIDLPGGVLPVEWDVTTNAFSRAVGGPELIDFLGVLDAGGTATATLDLSGLAPLSAQLFDERLSFAAWVYGNTGSLVGSPSNALDVVFR